MSAQLLVKGEHFFLHGSRAVHERLLHNLHTLIRRETRAQEEEDRTESRADDRRERSSGKSFSPFSPITAPVLPAALFPFFLFFFWSKQLTQAQTKG